MRFKWIPYTPVNKPLDDMTVAIVTTAGVHLRDDEPFYDNVADPDTSYRVIPGDARREQLTVTHFAPLHEYDPDIPKLDINTVFPIDRLKELVKEGFIAGLASIHYSFMGYMLRFQKLISQTLPLFIEDIMSSCPDAVLLTGGCPYSHRTVVVIQRAIEAQGIPSVLITVDPDKSANYRPPRAIYPQGLRPGRSTGQPFESSLQAAIVKAALKRLVTKLEPGTLEELETEKLEGKREHIPISTPIGNKE